ncbi:MAG TPA: SDR family NAD(P)-dependent oxidoreductase [Capsulimonadaceae bacterium]|jgi:NAD(P)-dependent dehydrogenase (short-subunit alcohol dehydrogenase family)
MGFHGKTAIVTGAANGIGKATALKLASEGAAVALADIDRDKVEAVAAAIRRSGGNASAFGVDITRSDDVRRVATEVLAEFGKIDILVNNAGAGWQNACLFQDIPDGSWEWIIDLNVKGTLYFTHAVLASMVERAYGKIVNVTSIAASVGIPRLAVYAASKGALVSFTKSLAMEVGPSGININCVSPGLVALESEPLVPCNGTFLGRKGSPDEFATVIVFLASDEASFITGAEYLVDGGRTLGPRGV